MYRNIIFLNISFLSLIFFGTKHILCEVDLLSRIGVDGSPKVVVEAAVGGFTSISQAFPLEMCTNP